MIHIRPELLAAFLAQCESALVARVTGFMQETQSEIVAGFPEPLLREMVENGLSRARRYDLSAESSLTAFVALMFQVAPNFDEQPVVQRVLTDARLPPDDRIDALTRRVKTRHWRDAQRRYDERAWFPELYEEDEGGTSAVRIRIRR